MDLEHERQRLLQRDAEWAALASAGQDIDRAAADGAALYGHPSSRRL
jgi:hypothetical protein